jgi:hypothetical protein
LGQGTTYTHDCLGRATGSSFGDGALAVGYSYDRAGRRIRMSDGARSLAYTWGASGHDHLPDPPAGGSGVRVWAYSYDGDGNTLSDGSVTWAYDLNDRVKTQCP